MVDTSFAVGQFAVGQDEHAALIARVKLISWLSLAWMTAEGVIGTAAGIMANSIALIGYGVDSTITGVASLIIIWRFTGARLDSDHAERQAQTIVAITFFLLAPYIIIAAVHHLVTGSQAQASWVGIGLALISVTLMPLFGRAKKRIGNQLHSSATSGEGMQNILCAYLSLAILVGLAANAVLGLWWGTQSSRLSSRLSRSNRDQHVARRDLRLARLLRVATAAASSDIRDHWARRRACFLVSRLLVLAHTVVRSESTSGLEEVGCEELGDRWRSPLRWQSLLWCWASRRRLWPRARQFC